MVRSADVISANKAEMLPITKFGLRDNLIKSELLIKEPTYTFIRDFRYCDLLFVFLYVEG